MDRCFLCEKYFNTKDGHLCILKGNTDNVYSESDLEELEKLGEKLRIATESEKSASDASLDTDIRSQDLDNERSRLYERDTNFSTNCFSQENQIPSLPVEPFITQCHKKCLEVSPSDSLVGAQQIISEDTEVNTGNSMVALSETSQVNFLRIDGSSSNPTAHFSATYDSGVCNLIPLSLKRSKNMRSEVSPSTCSVKENISTETFRRKSSSLDLTTAFLCFDLGNDDEANKPKYFRKRERISNEVMQKNDYSKENIDGIDKHFTPVSCAEAVPIAGPSGIQPMSHSNDTKNGFVCDVGSKAFGRRSHMLAHHRTHTREKTFVCDTCGNRFTEKVQLAIHTRTHTRERLFACNICGKEFSHKIHLEGHLRIHTREKPFLCHECGKGFSHKRFLKSHMLTHTGEKNHKCEVCGKGFTHKHNLKRHVPTHTGEKNHKCEVCGKGFTHKNSLQSHMLTHTGEKNHKCEVCGKGFTHRSSLKSHMLTHTGEKHHKCEVCGKGFADKSNCNRHYKKWHGGK